MTLVTNGPFPTQNFSFQEGSKFGLLAINNVYSDLPPGSEFQLADGTWVLTRVPFDADVTWKEWIGTINYERLKDSNVVLVHSQHSTVPALLDHEHQTLKKHVWWTFRLLQLSGVLEYRGADLLAGSFFEGRPEVRQLSELLQFIPSKGYSRLPVSRERLQQATELRQRLAEMEATYEFKRILRGLNALMNVLLQQDGQERMHQFVRSLEALILPEAGQTKRQFVHRCQTFARPGADTQRVLGEAFEMRSTCEHLHDWERSLQSCPQDDRDNVAWQRTRQMERLASFAYSRILESPPLHGHFRNEASQSHFWTVMDDAGRKGIWGGQLDLSAIPIFHEYDQWGRGCP